MDVYSSSHSLLQAVSPSISQSTVTHESNSRSRLCFSAYSRYDYCPGWTLRRRYVQMPGFFDIRSGQVLADEMDFFGAVLEQGCFLVRQHASGDPRPTQ